MPITIRQLLTHAASINDGPTYDRSYAPGDPTVSLAEWVTGYFTPGGRFYSESDTFLDHRPGTEHAYSNVVFGLLGYLVEVLAGKPFNEYCAEHIFRPLGMNETGWFLKDIDRGRHAIPHTYISARRAKHMKKREKDPPELVAHIPKKGGFAPLYLYSFPNYPDGLLRTSTRQFARFLIANLNGGTYENQSILKPATLDEIFRVQFEESDEPGRQQGLAWVGGKDDEGRTVWSHSGGDPGVSTLAVIRPADKIGVAAFANAASFLPSKLVARLLETPPPPP